MRVAKNFLVAVFMGLLGTVIGFSSTHAGTNTAQEQANMKLVADFYAALEQDYLSGGQRVRSIAERYLTPGYVQHMEAARGFGQGREGYIRMFEQSPQVPPPAAGEAPRPPTVMALMAQGDLVVRINSRTAGRERPARTRSTSSTCSVYRTANWPNTGMVLLGRSVVRPSQVQRVPPPTGSDMTQARR